MGNALCLSLDELAQESELDVVGHDVWGTLDLALLHEHLEVGHDLVLELLKPLVKLHVILVRARIVVLPATGLSPVGLGQLEGAVDLGVERAVPIASLAIELDGEHAGLDTKLEETATLAVGRAQNAFLALIAPSGAARDVTELRPREVVS